MSNLIPANWRDSLEQLKGNVLGVFDHWAPRNLRGRESDEALWPRSVFALGGPPVDVREDGRAVYVTAELPGLDEKDFSVELREGRLVLRGEKRADRREKRGEYSFSECSYGSFVRTIPLPCEIEADKVEAKYKNGVLRVTLPKSAHAQAKHIKVT